MKLTPILTLAYALLAEGMVDSAAAEPVLL